MRLAAITPSLWFDRNAEDAVRFYTGVFPDSRVTAITRYPEGVPGQPAGSVLTIAFELNGQPFTALNGGPIFTFTEAVSFQVLCETQEEIDDYWDRLSEGGDPKAQQCGWLKDRFGLSWQVVPKALPTMLADADAARVQRVTQAFLPMKKLDLAAIRRAFDGR